MPYSESIKFPSQLDNFPSLSNSTGFSIEEYQVVYAEHHNKLVNLIHVLQPLVVPTNTASGDGTVKGLAYTFTLSATLPQIFDLFGGPASLSSTLNQPGNILPFEAVITTSSDSYYHNTGRTHDNILLFRLLNAQDLYNQVCGGLNPFASKPIVSASLLATDSGGYVDGGLDDYSVGCYVSTCSDTMLIRGSIIDFGMGATINQTNSERWITSGVTLNITVMGVST